MADPEEKQLVEALDREVSRKGSLIALLACLTLGGGLAVSVVMNVLFLG